MSLRTALALGLALAAGPAAAAEIRAVTETVRAAGVDVRVDDVVITDKKAYAHMLWDTFPAQEALAAEARRRSVDEAALREEAAKALVEQLLRRRLPKAKRAKVSIVAFPARDDYGYPNWATIQKLGQLDLRLKPAPKPKPAAPAKPAKAKP